MVDLRRNWLSHRLARGARRSVVPWVSVASARLGKDRLIEAMAKSAARSVGANLGRQILRSVPGSTFKGR